MRRFRQFTPTQIAEAVAHQRTSNPDTHDELIADMAAAELTGGQADDEALADASRQVVDWMARQNVEAGPCRP